MCFSSASAGRETLSKPYSDADVAAYQMDLYWFLHDRRATLGAMIAPPSAPPQGP